MDHEIATEEVDDDQIAAEEVDDDEIAEDICRICRNPGDKHNPLRYPCACNGTIKFVHEDCLLHWLCRSKSLHCEVCKHPFSFSPVYAENAPTRLPFMEFVAGISMKHFHDLHFFLRLTFVVLVWLLIIPFITFWIWRLAFLRSFGEAQSLFLSHISTTVILADCLLGFLLSASIVIILLGPIPLRDFYWDLREGIPFDVLVGMQAPMFHLVKNAFTVLANNFMFLGFVIFVPFTLGRAVLYHVSWIFAAARGFLVTASIHFTDTGLSLENVTLKTSLTSISILAKEGQENGLIGTNSTLSVAADLLKGSDVTTLTVGYMFIAFLVFLYLGIIALIRYATGEQLTIGRFNGIASIVEAIPSLFRQFLVAVRRGTGVAFFVVVVIGVLPLMVGWWLDVCTIGMFDKTMSHRVQFLSISPLTSSLVHWVVGMMYMMQYFIYPYLFQEVLRPGVLYFLISLDDHEDEDDPFQFLIDEPVHKLAHEALLEVAAAVSFMFVQVFLPVKLAIWMASSIFPLDISVSNPFIEIPAGMLLFQICISFIMEHFRLWTTIKFLLRCWFTIVGWVLGLTDFLLPRPEENIGQDNGNVEPGRQNRAQVMQVGGPARAMAALPAADDPNRSLLSAGNVNTGEEYEDDEEQSDFEYNFMLRIILLLLVASVTLLLFNSALIVVQVSLGRALFSAIPLLPITHGIKCNDLYASAIGMCAFWTTISGAKYAIEHVMSKRTSVLLNQIWKWCGIVFKSSVLLAIWLLIIPVLIGLLFELLVIVPMRVPVDESPVFHLYQDWALGFIFLKIWTKLVLLDHMLPLVGDNWRAKFERVRGDGFSRLQGLWVLREIVFPIVMKLLTALCVPYVVAKGVFPMLGYPLLVNSAVYRFAWIGCLSVRLLCLFAKRCHVRFRKLHKSIRDERYLIGRRLHNFGEAGLANQNRNQSSEEDVDTRLRLRRTIQQDA